MLEPIPAEINATTQRRAAHSVDEFPGLLLRLLIMVPSPVTQYRRDRWRSASLATSSRAKCALEATSRENRPGILEAGRDGASLDRSPSQHRARTRKIDDISIRNIRTNCGAGAPAADQLRQAEYREAVARFSGTSALGTRSPQLSATGIRSADEVAGSKAEAAAIARP